MRYSVDPAAELRIVALDSLTAVYHRRSGQTHVVAEPVPEILAALGEGPADPATLMSRLGIASDRDDALQARLDELYAAGLIDRA